MIVLFIPDPGSESWLFTQPRSRIQGSKRHRIPDPDPQHWIIEMALSCHSDFMSIFCLNRIAHVPEHNLPWAAVSVKSLAKLSENLKNQQSKLIFFQGRTIPFCRKPELLEIVESTSRGLKNASNSLELNTAI